MVRPLEHTSISEVIASILGAARAMGAAIAQRDPKSERSFSADLNQHLTELRRRTCLTFRITFEIYEVHSTPVPIGTGEINWKQNAVLVDTDVQEVTFRDNTHMMEAMATHAAMQHRLRETDDWDCPLLANAMPFHPHCKQGFGPNTRVVISALDPVHGG